MSGQIVDTSISGKRLACYLDELVVIHGYPEELVHDNGPELTTEPWLWYYLEKVDGLVKSQDFEF